jgi:glycosyltransferase involved in cell wall biosynthesis
MGGLDPWKKSWQMPFYWALNRLPRAFVFQSQTERDVVCRRERIPQRRARIIPNGVDRTRFNVGNRAQARQRLSTELGLEEDVPVILSVGSLRPIKGHDILIRALHKLHERCPALPFQALIVGEGPLLNEYKTMARTLPLVFSGFREDVEWLYQAAAVYCQPSRSEGLPNAVIEAMCCGLPIVAADVGGLRELVGPDNGALFKPEDVDGLASRLEVMLTRGDKLTAMRQASELRSARFLDRAMVEQYLQLYERVGGEKSARVG